MPLEDATRARRRAEALAREAVDQSRARAEAIVAAAAAQAARLTSKVPLWSNPEMPRPVPDPAGPRRCAGVLNERAIAQAAYFKAQRRGFVPGRETEDWLEAERELSAAIASGQIVGRES